MALCCQDRSGALRRRTNRGRFVRPHRPHPADPARSLAWSLVFRSTCLAEAERLSIACLKTRRAIFVNSACHLCQLDTSNCLTRHVELLNSTRRIAQLGTSRFEQRHGIRFHKAVIFCPKPCRETDYLLTLLPDTIHNKESINQNKLSYETLLLQALISVLLSGGKH